MTMIEKKINKLVDEYWKTLDDMFDLVYNLICDCYEKELTNLKPELVEGARLVIINCIYEIRDNPKIEPKLNKHDWKLKFIQNFMTKTYVYWNEIEGNEDKFFLNQAGSLFSGFDPRRVNAFRVLFDTDSNGNGNISNEDKIEMWGIFIDLISIGIEITHLRRNPKLKNNKNIYGRKFIPEIKLKKYAEIWDVNLEYYENV